MDILHKDDERTFFGGLSDQDAGRLPSHPRRGSRRAATTARGALQQAADPSRQFSGRSERRMLWCSTAKDMACSGGSSSPHGIRIRRAEDESGNQPLPGTTTTEMPPASAKPARVFVLGSGRRSAGRLGLESFRPQIEVRAVRAGPGDGDVKRRRRRNFLTWRWNWVEVRSWRRRQFQEVRHGLFNNSGERIIWKLAGQPLVGMLKL